jgi:hypothetical protein
MEGVSLLEIFIWVSLSVQKFYPERKFGEIIIPISKSPTNLPLPSIISILIGHIR